MGNVSNKDANIPDIISSSMPLQKVKIACEFLSGNNKCNIYRESLPFGYVTRGGQMNLLQGLVGLRCN